MNLKRSASAVVSAGLVISIAGAAWAQAGDIYQITDSDIDSYDPEPTADGRFVAFWSFDTNIPGVTGATEGDPSDIGAQGPDVFLFDADTGLYQNLTPGTTGGNQDSTISQDGSTVVWNFVAGSSNPDTPPIEPVSLRSIAVYDRVAGSYSVADAGLPSGEDYRFPSVSADGQVIAFQSGGEATGDIFVKIGAAPAEAITTGGGASRPAVSGDGSVVAYIKDDMVIRHELEGDVISEVSEVGTENRTPEIDADGSVIVWEQVDSRDIDSGSITQSQIVRWVEGSGATVITTSNRSTDHPTTNADGSLVVFNSKATSLGIDNDQAGNDVYLFDANGPSLALVVAGTSDDAESPDSFHAFINDPGTLIGFRSQADNFGTDTVQAARDLYLTFGPNGSAADLPNPPSTTTTTAPSTTTTTAPTTTTTAPTTTSTAPRSGLVAEATTLTQIMNSTDYDSTDATALRMYRVFFDRDPDLAGAKYWIARVGSGESIDDIAWAFSQSTEFRITYGTALNNAQFLEIVYRNVLGRAYDQAGFDYWLGEMNKGLSRHATVRWIATNAEVVSLHPFAG